MSKDLVLSKGIAGNANPLGALSVIKDLCEDYMHLQEVREVEQTKRDAIKRDIEGIRAQRDVFMKILDRSFDERAMLFRKHFEVIDKALETNDIQMLQSGLTLMNNLAMKNPFEGVMTLNQCRNELNSGEEIDI